MKAKSYSESDAGSMASYGKSIGAHPMSAKQAKDIPSVKRNTLQKKVNYKQAIGKMVKGVKAKRYK